MKYVIKIKAAHMTLNVATDISLVATYITVVFSTPVSNLQPRVYQEIWQTS